MITTTNTTMTKTGFIPSDMDLADREIKLYIADVVMYRMPRYGDAKDIAAMLTAITPIIAAFAKKGDASEEAISAMFASVEKEVEPYLFDERVHPRY